MRFLAVLLIVLLLAVAGYFGYRRFEAGPQRSAAAAKPPPRASAAANRVVSDDGCGPVDGVTFTLTTASVGATIEGQVGRMTACESNHTERVSGAIDWGDGTSSAVEPGDYDGKDRGLVLAPKHAYKTSGTFLLFARIRAQCVDHGQSTRTIVCGSGTVEVR